MNVFITLCNLVTFYNIDEIKPPCSRRGLDKFAEMSMRIFKINYLFCYDIPLGINTKNLIFLNGNEINAGYERIYIFKVINQMIEVKNI